MTDIFEQALDGIMGASMPLVKVELGNVAKAWAAAGYIDQADVAPLTLGMAIQAKALLKMIEKGQAQP